jgi:hypothetical protein
MINPSGIVTLVAIKGGAQMLIGFDPEPGNYDLYTPPRAVLEHGDTYDFFCPVCHSDLKSDRHPNLCELIQYEDGVRKTLLFSRIAGERATYVIGGEDRPARHGEHNDRYDDDTIDITIE